MTASNTPSPLRSNPHLLPTTRAQRTWTAWEVASLWIGLVVGLPSYFIAGTLVEKGMTWWQGLIIVVGAKAVLLLPLILHAQPGTKYGIPFPILARSAFGVRGAHIPALLRALIACGWYNKILSHNSFGFKKKKKIFLVKHQPFADRFGIETWLGGQAIFILLPSSAKSSSWAKPIPWLATSPFELSCFAVFWLAQLAVLWKGMRAIRQLEKYSAPILISLASILLSWAYIKAGGLGPMLNQPMRLSPAEFWALFFPSLTANVGSWGAMALSISDFTRYARSQRDQVLGQLGLPLFMGSFTFVGLAVTSSTSVIFGHIISNPVNLLSAIGGALTMTLAIPGISLAILTTNIPANIVAPANALVSLSPSKFGFKRGALLTALIGAIVFQPWRIVNSPDSFVYTWLVGYSAVMGPLSGIMLTDYYVIRRTFIDVDELYSTNPSGMYYYCKGYNLAAILSLVVSLGPIVPGFLHKLGLVEDLGFVWVWIYNVGWFFGFFCSAVVYFVLVRFLGGIGGYCEVKGEVNGGNSLADPLLPSTVE